MFVRPFAFLLVAALSICNFIFVSLPLAFLLIGPWISYRDVVVPYIPNIIYLLIAFILALMLVIIVLDSLLGLTVWRYTRKARVLDKCKDLPYYPELLDAFNLVKRKFNRPSVKLYVDQKSGHINAYAIGSFRKNAIVITEGLIGEIYANATSKDQAYMAIRGILAHEMSHLVHRDFLPALLLSANETASHLASAVFRLVFQVIALLLNLVPGIGGALSYFVMSIYNIFFWLLNSMYRFIVLPVYYALQKALSRSIEYRCDRQAAEAFGGAGIAQGLSVLGSGSYFSIFSTHPRTKNRINYVEHIRVKAHEVIGAGLGTRLANILCLLALVWGCYVAWNKADYDNVKGVYQAHIIEPTIHRMQQMLGMYR